MNRRTFLAVLAALATMAPVSRSPVAKDAAHDLDTQTLDILVPDLEAAARLGRHYLASLAPGSTGTRLLAEIAQAMGPPSHDPAAPVEARTIARARRAVTDDYLQGRVVDVNGWVLSLTEARLFALATLGLPLVER